MERSFKTEIEALRLGEGAIFRGEGILAVTKALLQSGVAYVGGYQGAPVSHLLDVMVEAQDLLAELGVHVETCTNEAAAAAMLGASINYPLRGAVTWKSIVGTNVAADALSNLASPGVIGGTLIILGEDYGEGASVIQERSYAYAMKSSIWLIDPRPDLPTIVRMVEKGFELSEASHAPVMLELRIRACHLTGAFPAKQNRRAAHSGRNRLSGPPRFDYAKLAHPPLTFVQERRKIEDRLPAALAFMRAQRLNETLMGDLEEVGIIVMGGLANGTLRALARLGLADAFGRSRIPMLVLNVVYPLDGAEVRAFCAGKAAVLVIEEGFPDYIEQAVNVELRRADLGTRVLGKGLLPKSGEYQSDVLIAGLAGFVETARPRDIDADAVAATARAIIAEKAAGAAAVGTLPPRPPTFCTGCPERPVFTAIKLMQRELGPTHISGDIGCHAFATFAPFSLGNSILGYGMSLASAAAVGPNLAKRPIAVMGDGGFWHNGLITGVASHQFNQGDGVLIVMQNGYASATGLQYLPSSQGSRHASRHAGRHDGANGGAIEIERTLRSLGVTWLRKVRTYSVATMTATLKEAMRTAERGLKVIIADGECQLARQRRVRAEDAEKLRRGARVVKVRYGVDDALCTGDHSCIRLSGCPSLTVKPNPDPLRRDPVAAVIESCVGCGLCGEVAHAAVLCPSFYRAEVVRNASLWDRMLYATRRAVISWLMRRRAGLPLPIRERDGVRGTRTLNRGGDPLSPTLSPPGRGSAPAREESPSAAAGAAAARPITILIAALGGEGGGVLTGWIVRAAEALGLPVQSTSVPGVAQRTGSTTYYIEIWPRPLRAAEHPRPVLALTPGIGDIDIMVASELMEGARAAAAGFLTPDRTLAIASTARALVMDEKIAMGDGRRDPAQLAQAIRARVQHAILIDMDVIARRVGAMVNAVMLGALAASARLPIPIEAFEAAIRQDGKAVESNLRGFRAGLAANDVPLGAAVGDQTSAPAPFAQAIAALPEAARELATLGAERCLRYQDAAYARLYRERVAAVAALDRSGGKLAAETARHLALRMTYEDVVKVAQAKIDPDRLARIAGEVGAAAGEPVRVVDFLKPGIEEVCSVLPQRLAQRVLALAQRRGWRDTHWGMSINTTSVTGFLRFWLIAKLGRFRPRSHRFAQEQRAIEAWLALIQQAAARSAELALEIVACANLIKGYGDTHKRGSANFARIVEAVVTPALAGDIPPARAIDAIASARTAALADPEGESLARCLADIAAAHTRVAAE